MKRIFHYALALGLALCPLWGGELSVTESRLMGACRFMAEKESEVKLRVQLPPSCILLEVKPDPDARFYSPDGAQELCKKGKELYWEGYSEPINIKDDCLVSFGYEMPRGLHEWTALEGGLELTYVRFGEPVEVSIPLREPSKLMIDGHEVQCVLTEDSEVELRSEVPLVCKPMQPYDHRWFLQDDTEHPPYRYRLYRSDKDDSVRACIRAAVERKTERVTYRAERFTPEECCFSSDSYVYKTYPKCLTIGVIIDLPDYVAWLTTFPMGCHFTLHFEDGSQTECLPGIKSMTTEKKRHYCNMEVHWSSDQAAPLARVSGYVDCQQWELCDPCEPQEISLTKPGSIGLDDGTIVHVDVKPMNKGYTQVTLLCKELLADEETQFIENDKLVPIVRHRDPVIRADDGDTYTFIDKILPYSGRYYIYTYTLHTDATEVLLSVCPVEEGDFVRIPVDIPLKNKKE